jgi:hypothetical protein
MPSKTLHATILPKGHLWRARNGESFEEAAEVMNSGGARWKNASEKNRRHITLGIQLLDEQKRMLNRDFARVILPESLAAKQSTLVKIRAIAPKEKGNYWLKLDMVCEGIEWFESCGSPAAYQQLQVH